MTLYDKVKEITSDISKKIWDYRCCIHANPELSYKEFQTQKFVIEKLKEIGIEKITTCANTGVLALIQGNNNGKCVGIRADLDALPILEKNNTAYVSRNDGVMHACGHDFHTANLLGVAEILFRTKEYWNGTVKLIFQPGEEKNPGGASIMINEGCLENPKVDAAFALHVYPSFSAGQVGFFPGKYMASCDEIYIEVKGKGGHAALPKLHIDPLPTACRLILKLKEINQKALELNEPNILAFGKFIADGATNVIPEKIKIDGTFRAMSASWRNEVHKRIENICDTIEKDNGIEVNLKIDKGYPCLVNDIQLTNETSQALKDYFGNDNILPLDQRMSSEDFSFFSEHIPICYFRVGTNDGNGNFEYSVHHPQFDICSDATSIALQSLSIAAIHYLNTH